MNFDAFSNVNLILGTTQVFKDALMDDIIGTKN